MTICPSSRLLHSGLKLLTQVASHAQFVKIDANSWEDQLRMFKQAVAESPAKSVDIVVVNAGVAGPDEIFALEGLLPVSSCPSTQGPRECLRVD